MPILFLVRLDDAVAVRNNICFRAGIAQFPAIAPSSQLPLSIPSRISSTMRRHLRKELARNDGKPTYWLLKTEPVEWSWDDQLQSDGGVSRWDGVRNRQAQKNLKSMKTGDLCFFYHSGNERRLVGVVEVARTWYSTTDDRGDNWEGAVDVRTVAEMKRAVDLREIKAEAEGMKDFALLRQPRLSVVPVPERVWDRICEMGGGFGGEDDAGGDGEAG